MTDPTQRFTGRVEKYVRYHPSYPRAVLDLLETECGLTSASVVADVGSGTGILSELFLENGNRVIGIEPNEPPHVHIDRDDLSVKFWLDPVSLARNLGFSAHELRRLQSLVAEHQTELLEARRGYFGTGR